jgi:hypothetical protein
VLGTSSTDGHGHFRFEKSGEGLFDDSDYDLMLISRPLPGGLAHPVRALREAQLHPERNAARKPVSRQGHPVVSRLMTIWQEALHALHKAPFCGPRSHCSPSSASTWPSPQ